MKGWITIMRLTTIAVVVALMTVGGGCGSDNNGSSGDGGNGSAERGFQGDPELDGLKPGDCLKYPELDACN